MNGLREFCVYSWTLDDLKKAVSIDSFSSVIKDNLDSRDFEAAEGNLVIAPSAQELAVSKFEYAGGCPRYIFD
jgi:hypothetical protein